LSSPKAQDHTNDGQTIEELQQGFTAGEMGQKAILQRKNPSPAMSAVMNRGAAALAGSAVRRHGQERGARYRLFPPAEPAGGGDRPADFDLNWPSGSGSRIYNSISVSGAR
jgi:hypothetical protein